MSTKFIEELFRIKFHLEAEVEALSGRKDFCDQDDTKQHKDKLAIAQGHLARHKSIVQLYFDTHRNS